MTDASIVVFGDSITWGAWDTEGGGWVGRLWRAAYEHQVRTGEWREVYNLGVAGNRVADVLARFDSEIAARPPTQIILAVGINDSKRSGIAGTSFEDFERDCCALLDRAISVSPDVLVVGLTNVDEARREHNFVNEHVAELNAVIEVLADNAGLQFVDVFGSLTSKDLEPDGLHPGPSGHQKIFEAVLPLIGSLTCG